MKGGLYKILYIIKHMRRMSFLTVLLGLINSTGERRIKRSYRAYVDTIIVPFTVVLIYAKQNNLS